GPPTGPDDRRRPRTRGRTGATRASPRGFHHHGGSVAAVSPGRDRHRAPARPGTDPRATGPRFAHTETMEIWPGHAYPLGATYDGSGTNFALFTEVADKVELCLFDADGTEE